MNNLIFTKIEIENFRSIKDKVTLDIKPGLFSIEGVNNDEIGSTNGCGKSSCLSALYWCLTGNTLTNEALADEVINSISKKDCKVSVYLTQNDNNIKITRTRKDSELGNNLLLEINEQNLSSHKIADTQDRINQLIKLPLDLLKNTLMITCNLDSAFCELTPSQRVQVLENIRDYTIWDKIRDSSNKDIKDYNKEIKSKELEKSNLDGSLTTYEKLLKESEETFTSEVHKYDASNHTKRIKDLENKVSVSKKEVEELQAQKLELQKQIVTNDTHVLNEQLNKINEEGLALKQDKIELENTKNKNITEINYKLHKLEDEKSLIVKWFTDDTCPTCHRKLERTKEEIENKTKSKNSILTELQNLNEIKKSVEESTNEKVVAIETQLVSIRQRYKEINDKIQEIQKQNSIIPTKLEELDRKINNLNDMISKANENISFEKRQIELFEDYEKRHNEDIKKYTTEIENSKAIKTTIDSELKKLEEKRKISTFFYDLLGPKGNLRPYLLKQDIEHLNQFVQHYISRFFKGTNVNLVLDNNTIKIIIKTNEGIEKSISSLSGGEKKRLNISIQLALYDLMQSVSQTTFNMLWLDEVETQMDPLGCKQLIEIIEDKSSDIESVFWITNNDMVKENIVRKIICNKLNGITTIEEI